MLTEFGYVTAGAVAGIGGIAIMFRFLNAKIDKTQKKIDEKQSIDLCNERSGSIKVDLKRLEGKLDGSIITQGITQVTLGQVLQELKHINGKT